MTLKHLLCLQMSSEKHVANISFPMALLILTFMFFDVCYGALFI